MNQDEQIRRQRLVFYQNDIDRLDKLLDEFLRLSKAKCALLIDKDGHMITRKGFTGTFDMDTISALVAGSFAATKEMARLLGEEEFSVLFHQGVKDNIQLSLVGERTLLSIIFDDRTTVGMVRLYANELANKLAGVLKDLSQRQKPESAPQIDKGFGEAAKTNLDDVFGS
ncbi:MAG: roadblock/LC7 domain-containing protein [Planctomycetes bacterium]|nr:roadblock/LC7 domain-containing protein [Planctomycetota bacterium]